MLLLVAGACVPNRKIAYLQYEEEYNQPESITGDSLVRSYEAGELTYLLQPGDLLDIKISTLTPITLNPFADADRNLVPGQAYSPQYANPEQQVQPQGYYVNSSGILELPIIGATEVGGRSLAEAETMLAEKVKQHLDDPVVRVKILNFRFTVLGEVDREATLVSGDNSLSLLQAVGMAGGPSEYGDLARVKVIRRYGIQNHIFYVNLLSEEFLSSPFYFVQPNDIIVVTPLKQRAYLKYLSPNLSLMTASASLLVAIVTLVTNLR
ncbi:MAG: polysaccharide biosynthesis/export family protein [Bacteroidales bacterium]